MNDNVLQERMQDRSDEWSYIVIHPIVYNVKQIWLNDTKYVNEKGWKIVLIYYINRFESVIICLVLMLYVQFLVEFKSVNVIVCFVLMFYLILFAR